MRIAELRGHRRLRAPPDRDPGDALRAARAFAGPGRRIVCLFQPHRYTRTQLLCAEFATAFDEADALFVADIYPASEPPIPGVTGKLISDAVAEGGAVAESEFAGPKGNARLRCGNALRPGDVFITLGAGDIHEVGTRIAADLKKLEAIRAAMDDAEGKVKLYEPMSRHTTLRVGGPADFWIEPATESGFARAVKFLRAEGIPLRVIGRGSNLLVKDGGIRGAVLHPGKGEFESISASGDQISAGVGARFKAVAYAAREAGLGGFEWMEGIPGNVGGGLRMNAGAMGAETFDQVVSVRYIDGATGEIKEKTGAEFAYQYRFVPDLLENFAVAATFSGVPAERGGIDEKLLASRTKRRESQPVAPSAGCIFKNPGPIPAGKLVDELGLKNRHVGAARVSEVHGNFIVNDGGATAADVLTLIDQIKAAAREARGIELEPSPNPRRRHRRLLHSAMNLEGKKSPS
ncbi:MAG: UDP-N-acetylmuramate dehydrogenase [Verrucomicrobiales bacterium]